MEKSPRDLLQKIKEGTKGSCCLTNEIGEMLQGFDYGIADLAKGALIEILSLEKISQEIKAIAYFYLSLLRDNNESEDLVLTSALVIFENDHRNDEALFKKFASTGSLLRVRGIQVSSDHRSCGGKCRVCCSEKH